MTTPKIDLFYNPHKEQRGLFFEVSLLLGKIDFANEEAFSLVERDLKALLSLLREHAESEDTFVSSMLNSKGLKDGELLESEHNTIDDLMFELDALFTQIRQASLEARVELGVVLYQTFNRFMAHYFLHIDKEETKIMPLLWKHCRPEEIVGILVAFMAYKQPEEAEKIVPGILKAMTPEERDIMFASIKKCAPSEAYAASMKLAESVFDQK